MRSLTYCLTLSCLISGCVSTETLPVGWSEGKNSVNATCDWVNGLYENIGESGGDYQPYFTDLLDLRKQLNGVPLMVEVAYSADSPLVIKGRDSATQISSRIYSLQEYSCTNGMLSIVRSESINREGVIASSSYEHHLNEDKEHIVVKTSSSGLGMVFFLPIVAKEKYYYRFKRIRNWQ